jgi:phage head maturation protease
MTPRPPSSPRQKNGDLIIEGYAAVWEGDDRYGENFIEGAFQGP